MLHSRGNHHPPDVKFHFLWFYVTVSEENSGVQKQSVLELEQQSHLPGEGDLVLGNSDNNIGFFEPADPNTCTQVRYESMGFSSQIKPSSHFQRSYAEERVTEVFLRTNCFVHGQKSARRAMPFKLKGGYGNFCWHPPLYISSALIDEKISLEALSRGRQRRYRSSWNQSHLG